MSPVIGIGMVGYAFMGRAHSQAWRSVDAFFDRDDVQIIDICTPGDSHAEIAVAPARRFVEEGRLGEIRHVRAHYLQNWIVDPKSPLVWRLQKDEAGSGGDPLRARAQERAAHRDQRSPGQRALRLRGDERPVVPRPRGRSAGAADAGGRRAERG
ncbi:Gfo/Idh/MocA family protein [Nonomuraea turcica]|uniref:Gfo/Idh/MocA family protein n=1 Tax=Nonomuraea sp. G32 TaxID=3067274 RepID=UPI00273BEF39|nr:hypothetical protein [Nonomuraea sp. G32]MDP4502021.1 hypothetical protein [Nonomuraea sp. G32]